LNKRNIISLIYKGKERRLTTWSKEAGIKYNTLYARMRKGWDINRIFAIPKK